MTAGSQIRVGKLFKMLFAMLKGVASNASVTHVGHYMIITRHLARGYVRPELKMTEDSR